LQFYVISCILHKMEPRVPSPWADVAVVAAVVTVAGRRLLPPVATAALVGAGVVIIGVMAASVSHGARRRPPAWARRPDLVRLRVAAPVPGRLTLGRSPGRFGSTLVAGEARASVVVLGPSQSGKTSGLAIPALLEWPGPVVATSVKTDLVHHGLAWRASLGPTWVYDPTGSTGLPAAGWTPLARCTDWQSCRQVAAWLCSAARVRTGGDEDFWYGAAAKLLAPHLLAAASGRRTMAEVVRWIDAQDEDEVAVLLAHAGVPEASRAAAASWARDERTRSSVYATAELVLEAFADPVVATSAERADIQADRLFDRPPATLFVCAPGHEQERLRPVFSTLIHEILTTAYERANREGALDPPLLVVLDEAANIAPLKDLDSLAATAAGHGVQLVTVWQDLAQVNARYGERAATVVSNHRAKVFLSGISDTATLEYASRLLGEREVGDASVTTDHRGSRSTTRAWKERRLLTDAELRRTRPGQAVLVYGHLPPARLALRPWYGDAGLRRRAVGSRDPAPVRA
jgi:type IV secretion system protein VirD4